MGLRAIRTPDEIERQLTARYEELKREAESPAHMYPCKDCKWGGSFHSAWCHNPLVKGFGDKFHMGIGGEPKEWQPKLCGPEKALFEPRPIARTVVSKVPFWAWMVLIPVMPFVLAISIARFT